MFYQRRATQSSHFPLWLYHSSFFFFVSFHTLGFTIPFFVLHLNASVEFKFFYHFYICSNFSFFFFIFA